MWNDRYLNPCGLGGRACFDPLSAVMAAVTLGGAAVSAIGTIAGGSAANNAGQAQAAAQRQAAADNSTMLNYRADQEVQGAQESRAASQRTALEADRNTKLALSTLQARAAASGGGASDATVGTLAGQIAGRGEYQALTDLYTGENRARGLEAQATGDRYSAQQGIIGGNMAADASIASGGAAQTASYFNAGGTILGGAGSAYRTYNRIPAQTGYA